MLGLVGSSLFLLASQPAQTPPNYTLTCRAGPIERKIAGQPSSVFGCSDGRSLVIISEKKGNAAHFQITMLARGDGHLVGGYGSGDGTIVAAAFEEARKLTPEEIADLIRATKTR